MPSFSASKRSSRLALIESLISSLERLSADSYWAHQASGLRGSLLRTLERIEGEENVEVEWEHLDRMIERGYEILENAAREIRTPEINDLPGKPRSCATEGKRK